MNFEALRCVPTWTKNYVIAEKSLWFPVCQMKHFNQKKNSLNFVKKSFGSFEILLVKWTVCYLIRYWRQRIFRDKSLICHFRWLTLYSKATVQLLNSSRYKSNPETWVLLYTRFPAEAWCSSTQPFEPFTLGVHLIQINKLDLNKSALIVFVSALKSQFKEIAVVI